jgi:hypothetical protein
VILRVYVDLGSRAINPASRVPYKQRYCRRHVNVKCKATVALPHSKNSMQHARREYAMHRKEQKKKEKHLPVLLCCL